MISWHRSVCPHDCPDTCGWLVAVENGQVITVKGDPEHPFTRGFICVKAQHYPERVHSPARVLYPLKRTGPKGSSRFSRVSWDEALDEIVHRYGLIIEKFGAEAILPYSYAGTEGLINFHGGHAFFHRLGASKLDRTICSAAVEAGMAASLGAIPTTNIETTVHSDLIVIWGSNTLVTNIHAWPFFQEARRHGARIVVIDPYRNRTAKQADRHLRLKPGTDAALALGLMHVLIKEDLIDHQFIAEQTIGFERLVNRVDEYPLSRVQELTGVPAQEIELLAQDYGRARAPYIRLGWGPSRQFKGGMASRTILLLPALVGAFTKNGGGVTRSTGPAFAMDLPPLTRPDLSPPVRTINMVQLGQALTKLNDPPVMALHVYHSNPAAVTPDLKTVGAGLERENLFTVVHEHFLTDTARYADLVLPGATCLESTDLYRSYGHYYLQMARPVIPPLGESRPTLNIFQALAKRFDFTEEVFSWSAEDLIKMILPASSCFEGITFEKLAEGQSIRLKLPENIFSAGFKTPSGKVEFFSASLAARGLDPLPDGAPSLDPDGWGRYPLQLITPPRREFLNSTFNEIQSLREKAGPPTVMIHPIDAAHRGVVDGQSVRVFNDRGEIYLGAQVTEDVGPGVVVIEGLYSPRLMPENRGVNHLTSPRLTDMGGTTAFHGSLVEIAGR